MKILRIIARLNVGGPAINAILLTEGLNNERFESILVAGSIDKDEGDMSYLANEKNIDPIVIPELRRNINPINDIIVLLKLYRLIRLHRPDIVHTHTAKAGTLGRLAAFLFNLTHKKKIKTVHTFHGHVLSGYFNRCLDYVFVLVERFLVKFTDKIIVVSQRIKKDILSFKIGSQGKVEVVHLGFELDKFFDIQPRNNLALNIGIIGRLVPIKNHKMFLDAVQLLTQQSSPGIEYRFFVVGDGELRRPLEKHAAQLGIVERVKFMGWQKDLAAVYQNLDIITLTSLNEGTPVSLIEALASSRAVVATDVGGVRDLIGTGVYPEIADRGILVNSNDVNGFVVALRMLLKDAPLRSRLVLSGREFVRERFDKKRLIKDIEMVYNKMF